MRQTNILWRVIKFTTNDRLLRHRYTAHFLFRQLSNSLSYNVPRIIYFFKYTRWQECQATAGWLKLIHLWDYTLYTIRYLYYLLPPVAHLFNLSVFTSTVPQQWKQAMIRPIPKVNTPTQHADFRPISITPVLTRIMERTVVSIF